MEVDVEIARTTKSLYQGHSTGMSFGLLVACFMDQVGCQCAVYDPDTRRYYRTEIEGQPQTPYPKIPYTPTQAGTMVALTNPLYFGYNPTF